MPDGQIELGQMAADHRTSRGRQDALNRPVRQHAHYKTSQHQQFNRHPHPVRRFVRHARQTLAGVRAKENGDREPQRIRHAEDARQHRSHRQQSVKPRRGADKNRFGEKHFFGNKTVQQRHPGHGCARHHGQRGGDRHVAPQATEAAYIPRAGLVVNDADRHEQRRLEGRMVDDVKDRRHGRQRTVQTQQRGDETEVRDGRIGQQALQVILKNSRKTAYQQRRQTCAGDDPKPFVRARQHRPKPCQQEDTGLHHGRRMQISRDRRWRSHGVRQPKMERELRALGQCAQQNQHQSRAVQRMRPHHVTRQQHHVEVVTADDVTQDQHAGQQTQTAATGDDQRDAGAASGVAAVMPVANQQEREQAGQLPKQHQLNQVARQHNAAHGAHEGQQHREKTRHRVRRRHVVARIQHHQRPDAQHQHGEHPRKAVHAQHEVQTQRRQPDNFLSNHAARSDLREVHGGLHRTEKGNRSRQRRLCIASVGRQQRSDQTADKGKRNKCN